MPSELLANAKFDSIELNEVKVVSGNKTLMVIHPIAEVSLSQQQSDNTLLKILFERMGYKEVKVFMCYQFKWIQDEALS